MSSKFKKASDLIDDLDAHGAYDAAEIERELSELTGKKFTLPKFSAGNMRTRLGQDIKGPEWVDPKTPDHLMLVNGWEVAVIVAETLLGSDPSAFLHGRGSRARVCVQTLREAGL